MGDYSPAVFLTDFESAMICAINDCLPSAQVSGCLFHLKQSLNRQIHNSKRNIFHRWQTNVSLQQAINLFLGLVFLPVGSVDEVFKKYVFPIWNKTLKLEPNVQAFFTYVHSTYLGKTLIMNL